MLRLARRRVVLLRCSNNNNNSGLNYNEPSQGDSQKNRMEEEPSDYNLILILSNECVLWGRNKRHLGN